MPTSFWARGPTVFLILAVLLSWSVFSWPTVHVSHGDVTSSVLLQKNGVAASGAFLVENADRALSSMSAMSAPGVSAILPSQGGAIPVLGVIFGDYSFLVASARHSAETMAARSPVQLTLNDMNRDLYYWASLFVMAAGAMLWRTRRYYARPFRLFYGTARSGDFHHMMC